MPDAFSIAFGSHIDMVPDGGNCNGCVGSIGGLEIIVAGISHSPKEFTKGIDMANGANVLLQTILLIDKK